MGLFPCRALQCLPKSAFDGVTSLGLLLVFTVGEPQAEGCSISMPGGFQALNNPIQAQIWPLFEQEIGLEAS